MKRELLTSLLFKFSPSTQQIKKSTLSKIIENLLFLKSREMNSKEIHNIISNAPYNLGLTLSQVKKVVDQLSADNTVQVGQNGEIELTDSTKIAIEKESEKFEENIKVLEDFLSRYQIDLDLFLQALHYVFTKLGEQSINIINGKKQSEIIDYSLISSSLTLVEDNDAVKENLREAIYEFIKK